MTVERVKIVVGVPKRYVKELCQAIGDAGGGNVENYRYCCFSNAGLSRFVLSDDMPPDGVAPEIQEVIEERLEFTCNRSSLLTIIEVIRCKHPYKEPFIDVYPLLTGY